MRRQSGDRVARCGSVSTLLEILVWELSERYDVGIWYVSTLLEILGPWGAAMRIYSEMVSTLLEILAFKRCV